MLDAAVEVALGAAALGLVVCAVCVTALLMESRDRKRRGDRAQAERIAAGLQAWRYGSGSR